MPGKRPSIDVPIRRELDPDSLETLSKEAADAAEEAGYLDGNRAYRDLRNWDWPMVRTAIGMEEELIARFMASTDPATEEQRFDDERIELIEPEEDLWGLDVGVASAVLAISALGGAPVSSCNGGVFGSRHQASHPYVTFYLPKAAARTVLDLAEAADVGLIVISGTAQVYANDERGLLRFARLAWARHARPS